MGSGGSASGTAGTSGTGGAATAGTSAGGSSGALSLGGVAGTSGQSGAGGSGVVWPPVSCAMACAVLGSLCGWTSASCEFGCNEDMTNFPECTTQIEQMNACLVAEPAENLECIANHPTPTGQVCRAEVVAYATCVGL
jgi:hypothetical protein